MVVPPVDSLFPKDFTDAPRGDDAGGINPTVGRGYQRARLLEHVAGTVVDRKTVTDGANTITTVRMLDGSTQIYTGGPGLDKTEFYDPAGVLTATRTVAANGTATVALTRQGKPPAIITEHADGTAEGEMDGLHFPSRRLASTPWPESPASRGWRWMGHYSPSREGVRCGRLPGVR